MKRNILYGGIDVDDQRFHVCLAGISNEEPFEFFVKPHGRALGRALQKYQQKGYEVLVCYEAGYLGFSLLRDLRAQGLSCEVVAPSLIPQKVGAQVKTDRLDARKLARYYQKGLLTTIGVPTLEEERVRSLFRSKDFFGRQRQCIRDHISGLCRNYGLSYRQDTHNARGKYWTQRHLLWLQAQAQRHASTPLGINLTHLLFTLRHFDEQIRLYHSEVIVWSQHPRYQEAVQALVVYRGIREEFAMRLLTEIGDIRRFSHPYKLVSYVGLDIAEYSSGGKENKRGITHQGNGVLRWILIEIAQTAKYLPKVTKQLAQRRRGKDPQAIAIANRAMKRLYGKAKHLEYRGKHTNVIKVACARELVGFIWETLTGLRDPRSHQQAA